jgi:hypothetical protein
MAVVLSDVPTSNLECKERMNHGDTETHGRRGGQEEPLTITNRDHESGFAVMIHWPTHLAFVTMIERSDWAAN